MFDPVSTEAMVTMMLFFGLLPMIWQSTQLFYFLSSKLAEKIPKIFPQGNEKYFWKTFLCQISKFLKFTKNMVDLLCSHQLFVPFGGSDVSCCILRTLYGRVVPRSKVDSSSLEEKEDS